MAVDKKAISAEQVSFVLQLEEGHFADLKARDVAPAKLSRTLAGFANADGGELYVGIDEVDPSNRAWRGFDNVEAANAHI